MAQTHEVTLPAVVAGVDAEFVVGEIPEFEGTETALARASLVVAANRAQDGTDSLQLHVGYRRAGAAAVVLGTLDLGAVALVADEPTDFALTAAERSQLRARDVLVVTAAHTGAGGALAAGAVASLEVD